MFPDAVDLPEPAQRPAFMIVHVSDLHFGAEMYPAWTRTGAPLRPRTPPSAAFLPGMHGAFPHDPGACRELQNEIQSRILLRNPRQVVVVASGDLTALGDDSEFALALTFLRSRVQTSWHSGLGLGPYAHDVRVVPGNHDHALGRLRSHLVQRAAPLHGIYVHDGPEWSRTYTEDGLVLEVFGLDTCSSPGRQWLARGGVADTAMGALGRKMDEADDARRLASASEPWLRLLVCHHSPSGGPSIAADLAGAIRSMCAQRGVHFVLSGHTHAPEVPLPRSTHRMGLDLRCGTTLQGALPGRLPSKHGQVFLVHWIWRQPDRIVWQTEPFQRIVAWGPDHVARGPFTLVKARVFRTALGPP